MVSGSFSVEVSVTENGRKSPGYSLDTDLDGEVSLAEFLAFTKQTLILVAYEVLTEEQAQGFDKEPVVVVDGRLNKPVASVSPLGSLEFRSRVSVNEIVLATYNGILQRSPVDTGRYISGNYVFLNGTQVATDLSSLTSWLASNPDFKESDLIRFVNINPYARKLERYGVTAQRQQSRTQQSRDKKKRSGDRILAPNGAYYLTTRSIRRLFKRNSIIAFSFIPGSQIGLSQNFKTQSAGVRGGGKRVRAKKNRTYLYPTITISVSESGTL